MKGKQKPRLILVDESFHKKIKTEASQRGLKMVEYTKKLGEGYESLDEYFKKQQEKEKNKFNLRF